MRILKANGLFLHDKLHKGKEIFSLVRSMV